MASLSFSSLHQAAAAGDINAIKAFVTSGADINAWDPWGKQKTPLIYAIEAHQVEAVKTLISLGADINLGGFDDQNQFHSPIYFALSNMSDLPPAVGFGNDHGVDHYFKVSILNKEYSDIAYDLYKSGASLFDVVDKNLTPIMVTAIENNDVISVQSLLSPYVWNYQDKYEVYFSLSCEGDKTSQLGHPILVAASNGNVDILNLLFENSFPPDTHILTEALSLASKFNDDVDCAKLLLEKGANPNGSGELTGFFQCPLKDALFKQTEMPNLEMAKLLLEHGADDSPIRNYINTFILFNAITPGEYLKGAFEVINSHSEQPIDVNSPFDINIHSCCSHGGYSIKSGDTPLHNAILNHYPIEGIKFLIEMGANPTLNNKEGKNSLDYAKAYGNEEIMTLVQNTFDQFPQEQPAPSDIKSQPGFFDWIWGLKEKAHDTVLKLNDVIDVQSSDLSAHLDTPVKNVPLNQNTAPTQSESNQAVLIHHDPLVVVHTEAPLF